MYTLPINLISGLKSEIGSSIISATGSSIATTIGVLLNSLLKVNVVKTKNVVKSFVEN